MSWLFIPYLDRGRDPAVGLDCWGLVRLVLHHDFGLPLLPAFGPVGRSDRAGMDGGYRQLLPGFERCDPVPGAVACCFDAGGHLRHVGAVVADGSAVAVLHTGAAHGVIQQSVAAFVRGYTTVEFWRYAGASVLLSEQAV